MANALSFLGKRLYVGTTIVKRFSCTLSGSYTQGGAVGVAGETLAFNSASNPSKAARIKIPNGGSSGALPANTDMEVVNPQGGFSAQVERNAVSPTAQNFVLRIFQAGSGAAQPAELTAGAYPAALLASPLVIEVTIRSENN